MDTQQFLAEFGHIANAPGGVKRLRELLLQLAIGGHLVQQLNDDIDANTLIESNLNRKAELISRKRLKRLPDTKPIVQKDTPWAVPEGWAWTRLGLVTNYGDAPKIEFEDVYEDTWVLELEDIEKESSKLLNRIRARDRKFKSTKNGFPAGAILYGKLRPYLDKVIISDLPGVCTTEISPISFYDGIESGYLRWYLKSPYFISYASGSTYGMNLPRLGTDAAREALLPLPPKIEQTRIVAKVDELMALCDELEQQQHDRRELQNALRHSTLQAVASAQSIRRLEISWKRLDSNFNNLFGEQEDVRKLRDVLCDLATRGVTSPTSKMDLDGNLDNIVPRPLAHGWEWKPLSKLSEYITSGSRGWKSYVASAGDSFIRSQDIKYDELIFENPVFVKLPDRVEGKRTLVQPSDVLITITGGNVGRCAVVPELPRNAYVSQHVALVRLVDPRLSDFIHFWMVNEFGGQAFLARFIYGDKPGLNLRQVGSVLIPVPPMETLPDILRSLRSFYQLCEHFKNQLKAKLEVSDKLVVAAVNSITGISIAQEEDAPVKAPQTELIAPLRLGSVPDVKAQAPLATILARHDGELAARDLWQRFGGDIDAFYAQLKTEVQSGWIAEPAVAEVRERSIEATGA